MATKSRARVTPAVAAKASAAIPLAAGEVIAVIPTTYTLTQDDGTKVTYYAGTQRMPKEHLNHWWSQANKVKQVD